MANTAFIGSCEVYPKTITQVIRGMHNQVTCPIANRAGWVDRQNQAEGGAPGRCRQVGASITIRSPVVTARRMANVV
jgi:hypothetical protein